MEKIPRFAVDGTPSTDQKKNSNDNIDNYDTDMNTHGHGYSPTHTHLKTYTAGEDHSRLAAAAKELGLSMQQARQPRKQVRQQLTTTESTTQLLQQSAAVVQQFFTNTALEDARMRAIYSAHSAEEYGGEDYLVSTGLVRRRSLPHTFVLGSVLEEEEEEEGGGGAVDEHGLQVGGGLVSACTGTYSVCLVCGGGCGGDAITRYSIQLGMALLFSLFLFLHSRDSFVSSFLKYYIFQN
jgi:hypothetical protein